MKLLDNSNESLIQNIVKNIEANRETEKFDISFDVFEISALNEVATSVYNLFCDESDKLESAGKSFSPEINYFLDNLSSAISKLNK